ncbi:acyl-[acyl-carrier-protein]-phospholipid O-acyltransferase / long-chain-fatty-acid--[acyl-carrier-protein] ligase [Verrucomicrobium sp. GAS474]|uniref:AMP-binding protein n=1 Tax=Verrucomicrobium sp. GAS474 TaxID=1882831 RepID=UPI00087D208C|nr:AMP-binding protein [Verrucomicrobium sp. GAS474]SDU20028.1 acyl-[acyl-carrier-protein]-phospholipid O-acyltransferase / long-chain-fatty-acid--[acyl-carrier-protein] ligase [Verrucomicrobium sp. GAS474]
MPFSVSNIDGESRIAATGPALLLVHSWSEIDPKSFPVVGGRVVRVWPGLGTPTLEEAQELLQAGHLLAIRADSRAEFGPGLGALNPLVVALVAGRKGKAFPIFPAVADPETRSLHLGPVFDSWGLDPDLLRLALYDLGVEVFRRRPSLAHHMGYATLLGLKKQWFKPVFIDGFQDGRVLNGGTLFAVAWEFSRWIRKHVPEKRVGVVLPPGLGSAVTNVACLIADKTPVNLNFTAGRAANEAALSKAGIGTILSVDVMRSKAKDFPWPEAPRQGGDGGTIDIRDLLGGLPKWRIGLRQLIGTIVPAPLLRLIAGIPGEGGDAEAALLFTSGSSGEPKGVILTHRNILGNTAQTDAVLDRVPIRNLLACLPIFHSFGCTVTFWWPILGGPQGVTNVSPTETAKLVELIEKYEIGLLLNTPTFLRAFLRKATPQALASLKMVVTGAEKLPPELRAEFEAKFGVPVCEGYGMTEATPVVAVNLVDFRKQPTDDGYEEPRRHGSVGRLIPGMSIRIRHPETGVDQPLGETGMIWLRGVNIFPGYLNDPHRTAQVLRRGWYQTGDLGRLDADGFLFIEGRLSRFSKLGGEMVPHGTIEEKIVVLFPELFSEEAVEAGKVPVILGVEDKEHREELVLLTPLPIERSLLQSRLSGAGLPNLWIPRRIVTVAEIPRLGTGKVDLKGCLEFTQAAS